MSSVFAKPVDRSKVEYWDEEIRMADRYREEYGQSSDWDRWRDYVKNRYEIGYSINKAYAIRVSQIAQIIFRNPAAMVTVNGPMGIVLARAWEKILNWLIQKLNVKLILRPVCGDAFDFGTGIIKPGWDSEFGMDPDLWSEAFGTTMSQFGRKGERIEYNAQVVPGYPWLLRCHPRDFFMPWGCGSIDRAPWVAYRVVRHIDDVRSDPKYKNTRDLSPTRNASLPGGRSASPFFDTREFGDQQFVELIEIHDARDGFVKVYADCGHYNRNSRSALAWLRNQPDELQIPGMGLPAIDLRFDPDDDTFWGSSTVMQIEQQLIEANETRDQVAKHRSHVLLKALIDESLLGPEGLQALVDGNVAGIIKVQNVGNRRLGDAIELFKSTIPTELIMWYQQVDRDMNEVSGLGTNQTGEYSAGRHSATEANIVDTARTIRVDDRRDQVTECLSRCMNFIAGMVIKFWTPEDVQRLVGLPPQLWQAMQSLPPESYRINIRAESTAPYNLQQRQQEATQAYQMLSQNALVNQRKLATWWFEHLTNLGLSEELFYTDQELAQMAQAQSAAQNPADEQAGTIPMRRAQ